MARKEKLDFLKSYAENEGYEIDYELTEKLRNSLSDDKMNIRVPSLLKELISELAEKEEIPYQRYVKKLLIEAVSRKKVG